MKFIKMWWRVITRRETPMERAQRAIKGAKKDSAWLAERPFSDKYGYDGSAESSRMGDYFDDVTGHDSRRR